MGTLTPEAFIKLYFEILEYQRKHKLGVYGLKNSKEFIDKVNAEYDLEFKKECSK
jgi:hypothetical protein